jgi:hypothetical protein
MLGLLCVIGGLFLAAGFKEALWPKVMGVAGMGLLIVGFVANAVMSRHRPSRGD